MNPGMKYVFFRSGEFVIFPARIPHDVMAEKFFPDKPISAGFCSIEPYRNEFDDLKYNVKVFGESLSLKLQAIEQHGVAMGVMLSDM